VAGLLIGLVCFGWAVVYGGCGSFSDPHCVHHHHHHHHHHVWHFSLPYDDDGIVDATAGIVEGASDTETDDDATTQDNHADDVSVAASAPTPRRLRGLPARRTAAANAVPRSQPFASSSQSQSTICPVCLAVICDSAIVPCGHCLCSMSSDTNCDC